MKNKEDWKFDKKKASTALQELSRHINPFRDENVAELVRVITYCMDLEQSLDKACEELSKTYQRTTCGEYKETCTLPFCAKDTCRYSRRLTKKEWKEWCIEDDE